MSAFVSGKRLLFVTGTRADYGKLEPLALAATEVGQVVTFFVTGMHMMEKFGLTKTEVHRQSQFRVVEFTNQRDGDPQDIILAKTVIGFSDYLQEHRPDLVIIHGDRVEALACSLVCAINYIRCAHVEGGEVSGTIDELFRHCNTKLSSVHLVSSEQAKRRVLSMGESGANIHVIGSPELDIHMQPSGVSLDEVRARYEIPYAEYGICVFHPVTSEVDTIGRQAEALFGSLGRSGRCFVVIAPNNDPGSAAIFAAMENLPRDRFRVLPSMRFRHFSELMKNAAVFVGNSSAGVREVPFLGIPSLDLGTRQSKRAMSENVVNCRAEDDAGIQDFLVNAWGKRMHRHGGFGSGNAAARFVELLTAGVFWATPLQKNFVDHG